MNARERIEEQIRTGQPFRPIDDPSLYQEMMAAAEKCHDLNQLRPLQTEQKQAAMKDLLGELGERLMIFLPFHAQYGSKIRVGNGVTFNRGTVVLDMAPVTFGNDVMVGPNCSFFAGNHSLDPVERKYMVCSGGSITVEDDVWLGGNCIVTAGVTIGQGAVIGAGSVVTKDIPPMVVAAGNPCRVIRDVGPEDRLMGHAWVPEWPSWITE